MRENVDICLQSLVANQELAGALESIHHHWLVQYISGQPTCKQMYNVEKHLISCHLHDDVSVYHILAVHI